MRYSLLLCLALWSGTLPLYPQESPVSESAEPDGDTPPPTPTPVPFTNVQFSVFVWPSQGIQMSDARMGGVPRVFYEAAAGNQSVVLTRNTASPLYPYSGRMPIEFYDLEEEWTPPPSTAPPGTPPVRTLVKRPQFRADFPLNWRRVLIMLFPGKRAPDGTMLTISLPYDEDGVTKGHARIMNASDQPVVIQFDEAKDRPITLKPNENVSFDPRNLTDQSFARVFVYTKGSRNDVDMVHTSRLFFEQDASNYFFMYPHGRGRLRIMRLGGHPNDPTPAPQAPGTSP